MSQPKHKRQTKHRGNAAGMIESRGRTGRPLTAQERKSSVAGKKTAAQRGPKPPSWRSAITRGLLIGVPVMVFLILVNSGKKHAPSIVVYVMLAVLLVVLYIPLMYFMDRKMYERALRKQAAAASGGGGAQKK